MFLCSFPPLHPGLIDTLQLHMFMPMDAVRAHTVYFCWLLSSNDVAAWAVFHFLPAVFITGLGIEIQDPAVTYLGTCMHNNGFSLTRRILHFVHLGNVLVHVSFVSLASSLVTKTYSSTLKWGWILIFSAGTTFLSSASSWSQDKWFILHWPIMLWWTAWGKF